jgi:hypothetical protein
VSQQRVGRAAFAEHARHARRRIPLALVASGVADRPPAHDLHRFYLGKGEFDEHNSDFRAMFKASFHWTTKSLQNAIQAVGRREATAAALR